MTKVGTDMENIQKELEKLFCYTLDKQEILAEDVEEICTTQITNQVFDMVEAVAKKQQRKALDYYYDLLALKRAADADFVFADEAVSPSLGSERHGQAGISTKRDCGKSRVTPVCSREISGTGESIFRACTPGKF